MIRSSHNAAFSLIEVMVVVAIIALIAAFALPNLGRSKTSANESAAIGVLRSCVAAQQQYHTRFGKFAARGFDLVDAGFIDGFDPIPGFPESGSRSGYGFHIVTRENDDAFWSVIAMPLDSTTGERRFYVDTRGVIRVSASGLPTHTSPPLE